MPHTKWEFVKYIFSARWVFLLVGFLNKIYISIEIVCGREVTAESFNIGDVNFPIPNYIHTYPFGQSKDAVPQSDSTQTVYSNLVLCKK